MSFRIGKPQKNLFNAVFRPHRLTGFRSPLDEMIHPDDPYNRPEIDPQTPPKAVAMPDFGDAAIRAEQAKRLKELLAKRGRSSTLLSGSAGDQRLTPTRKATLVRGG